MLFIPGSRKRYSLISNLLNQLYHLSHSRLFSVAMERLEMCSPADISLSKRGSSWGEWASRPQHLEAWDQTCTAQSCHEVVRLAAWAGHWVMTHRTLIRYVVNFTNMKASQQSWGVSLDDKTNSDIWLMKAGSKMPLTLCISSHVASIFLLFTDIGYLHTNLLLAFRPAQYFSSMPCARTIVWTAQPKYSTHVCSTWDMLSFIHLFHWPSDRWNGIEDETISQTSLEVHGQKRVVSSSQVSTRQCGIQDMITTHACDIGRYESSGADFVIGGPDGSSNLGSNQKLSLDYGPRYSPSGWCPGQNPLDGGVCKRMSHQTSVLAVIPLEARDKPFRSLPHWETFHGCSMTWHIDPKIGPSVRICWTCHPGHTTSKGPNSSSCFR